MINPRAGDILKGGLYTSGTLIQKVLGDSRTPYSYGFPRFVSPFPDYSAFGNISTRNASPVLDVSAWISASKDSAREMMIEREMLLKNTGQDPLTSTQIGNNYNIDALYSFLQFINDDYSVITGDLSIARNIGLFSADYLSLHGQYVLWTPSVPGISLDATFAGLLTGPVIQPYSPEQIGIASFIRNERLAKNTKDNATRVLQAVKTGTSTGNLELDIAAQTVKAQLASQIALDQSIPIIGNKNLDTAATLDTSGVRAQQLAVLAVQQFIDIPVEKLDDAKVAKLANLLQYWKENYPTVELLKQFNPQLTDAQFNKSWKGIPNAPLVNVRITQRLKPMPKLGFFAKYGQFIGLGLMLIPGAQGFAAVALTAASIINTTQTQLAVKRFKNSFEVPTSFFEPQYKPVPFFIVLPIDEAQAAVKQPWYVPMLSYKFRDESGGLYNPFK